jgi:hypothetical protein
MPIIFVHGVATRDQNASRQRVEPFLKRYIAPEIAADPDHVKLFFPYWGNVGAGFAWDGISRPRSSIFGMGGETEALPSERAIALAAFSHSLAELPVSNRDNTATGGLAPAGPNSAGDVTGPLPRLKDLTPEQLSDVIATVILSQPQADEQQQIQIILVADAVVHAPNTFTKLARCLDTQSELTLLQQLILDSDRLGETLNRSVGLPGFVATRVLTEVRRPLNDFVTLFFGDVFKYLNARGNASALGEIPQIVLAELDEAIAIQQRTGEPIVVLSHSMGGQIVYDLVTHFLPNLPQYQNARIDFWCATASQVGFFEELKLFLESKEEFSRNAGNLVPHPDCIHLGHWWNVWDPNDFISYSAKDIIADVDDAAYDSGMGAIRAHGGYLERPSFFWSFAEKIKTAKQQNWGK